jgi:hypothetical protein
VGSKDYVSLMVRTFDPPTIVTMTTVPGEEDTYRLAGLVIEEASRAVSPAQFSIKRDDLDRMRVDGEGAERTVLAVEDQPGRYIISGYALQPLKDGQEYIELHSGTWVDDGAIATFAAMTDPVPLILVAGGVALAVCVAQVGIGKWLTDCEQRMKEAIDDCRANGGLPSMNADVHFGMSFRPFRLGCSVNCQVVCRPPGSASVQVVYDDTARSASETHQLDRRPS